VTLENGMEPHNAVISLFVETGIQYVDLERSLDFEDQEASRPHAFRIRADGTVEPLAEAAEVEAAEQAWEAGEDWAEQAPATETTIRCTATDALEVFSRQWIPIPYHSTYPFWVRAFLEPVPGGTGQTHRAVLACDTHSRTEAGNDELGLLRASEIGHTFSVNPELEGFWTHPEVMELVHTAWQAWLRRARPEAEAVSIELQDSPAAAQAKLWALVRYLARHLPAIRITTGTAAETVDAHLVLDLGNCRTCGIIVEKTANAGPFYASLEIRSHELPWRKQAEPFESHMQFVRPRSDRRGRFGGISLIRLGDEALEAAARAGLGGALTGMSSPKRYLWDDAERPANWCFVPDETHPTPAPIEGAVLRYLDPREPFRPLQVAIPPNPEYPRYSRKAGLVFLLLEILEQAFGQMNSIAHRRSMPVQGGEGRRRVFRSLVLVHPSGMTPLERERLRRGAQRAIDIWYNHYRDPIGFRNGETELRPPPPMQPKPTVHLDCDEGNAVQVCYLYGEVQERFQADTEGFLRTTGRRRNGQYTLRIASLDIGGGTTDLVISEYSAVEGPIGYTCLEQRPLFRDGISLGGDDIAKAVLTDIIFRDIASQLGVSLERWQDLFRQSPRAVPPEWEAMRRQLVNQVWVPLARYYWGWTERNLPEERVSLQRALSQTSYPAGLLKRFNRYLQENLTEGRPVDVSALEFVLSPDDFRAAARKVFRRHLQNFCDIIAQFDCDILLVAGRAAGLPELMRMLVAFCPLPPGRITSLQGHQVEGRWFPFAKDGIIADAKNCVVVGAAIHFIATQLGGRFVLRPKQPWQNHVIIGVANPKRQMVPDSWVLFRPDDGSDKSRDISFAGELWIGCRNIDDELAYANALYEVRWAPRVQRRIQQGRAPTPEATIQLARRKDDPFTLRVESARPTPGQRIPITREDVAIRLHTIYGDDYWLDTGCFYD